MKQNASGKHAAGRGQQKLRTAARTRAAEAVRPQKTQQTAPGRQNGGATRKKIKPASASQARSFQSKKVAARLQKTAAQEVRGSTKKLRIIPLGGLGEVGKNMTAIEWKDQIIVIDCGMMFPKEDMFGIDYVIPDTTYLEKNVDKVKGFFITHGHEDHIGATPYVLGKFNVPVYGTRLTLAFIENKLSERGIKNKNLRCIEAGDRVSCGIFEVEFIKVSHSIDDAVGLAIHTPLGTVVHTGDFKIDYTPIDGKQIDLQKFAELGRQGVLALMSDSTNAERPGYTISEKNVGAAFGEYFAEAKGRIIIATFASNIHRLQQVIDQAKRYNRKVCLTGRSMVRNAGTASELGYLNLPEKMQLSIEDLAKTKDNKIVVLTTGSQGEEMSGLVRMAAGEHSHINIKAGDTVIISSTPIPGNERYVSDLIDMLYRRGANVIYGRMAQVHVSGHACQEELKLMLSLTKPKYFIPVHGEERHIYSHAELAYQLGMKKSNVFISENGRPVEITAKQARFGEPVPSGIVLIDGLGIGDVGSSVLRDRKTLSQDGLLIASLTLSRKNGALLCDPEIITRGFVYTKEKEGEDILRHVDELARKIVAECRNGRHGSDGALVKGRLRKVLSSYLYNKTNRNPMILPIVTEI